MPHSSISRLPRKSLIGDRMLFFDYVLEWCYSVLCGVLHWLRGSTSIIWFFLFILCNCCFMVIFFSEFLVVCFIRPIFSIVGSESWYFFVELLIYFLNIWLISNKKFRKSIEYNPLQGKFKNKKQYCANRNRNGQMGASCKTPSQAVTPKVEINADK